MARRKAAARRGAANGPGSAAEALRGTLVLLGWQAQLVRSALDEMERPRAVAGPETPAPDEPTRSPRP